MPKPIKPTKNFFKIKKELVFEEPKNWSKRKLVGVIFLILGTMTLLSWWFFSYLLPSNFFAKISLQKFFEENDQFILKRVLIPNLGLDILVDNGEIKEIKVLPSLKFEDFKPGQEVILFSDKAYQIYKIVNLKIEENSNEQSIFFSEPTLIVTFPLEKNLSKVLLIEAKKDR